MTRPGRLVAQVRSGGHALSSVRIVARCVALTAQANGWSVVDFCPGDAQDDWGTADPSGLGALPPGTPVVLHLGTGDDTHLAALDPSPPGPVLLVHHGGTAALAMASTWHSGAVAGVTLGDDDHRALEPIAGAWKPFGRGAWKRLSDALVPDAVESALLAAHQGPHVTASGPLDTADTARWVAMASALVHELRPDATVAILPAGPDEPRAGPARQIAELGLASCQLASDATAPVAISHLRVPGVYLRGPGDAVDPMAGLARAQGSRIVAPEGSPDADTHYDPTSIASVAAAVDVALDLPRNVPIERPDDTWLWPLFSATAS